MTPPRGSLREQAIAIWQAGVDAVDSERLVRQHVRSDAESIHLGELSFPLSTLGRIEVIGAGKAGAGMAAGLEASLHSAELLNRVSGWVNVPSDCVRKLQRIHLHPARPVGLNEPTVEGVRGTREILRRVSELGPSDLCLVLLSGGGSALLPAPVPEITLQDKQALTRFLSKAGATIQELNSVRQQLSEVKGGRLAQRCRAGNLVALIISDVVGDPLDIIASGPTYPAHSSPSDAIAILQRFAKRRDDIPASIWHSLEQKGHLPPEASHITARVHHQLIGNNQVALNAARARAESLGYPVHSLGSDNQGEASEVGRELARLARQVREGEHALKPPLCILSGGEPVVHLAATEEPRKGGRNQELVLGAATELWDDGLQHIAILSGGTDGEDGPTDAAGAVADAELIEIARSEMLHPEPFLAINNSYPFFQQCGALIQTGLTHTNVMDLRVVLIED